MLKIPHLGHRTAAGAVNLIGINFAATFNR
jgi:hypothetical protein